MTTGEQTNMDTPDFLGTAARIDMIGAKAQQLQEQAVSMRVQMLADGFSLDDQVPDPNPGPNKNDTFREEIAKLNAGGAALLAEHADIEAELHQEAERRRDAIEKSIALQHAKQANPGVSG